jgi:hypothetical protein
MWEHVLNRQDLQDRKGVSMRDSDTYRLGFTVFGLRGSGNATAARRRQRAHLTRVIKYRYILSGVRYKLSMRIQAS